jgi:hypothetical protein
VSISLAAAAAGTNTQTYAVTPSVSYKGALQTGDKLVFYYVKGDSSGYLYQTGPYGKASIEFSKADIEALTVTPKTLVVPKAATDAGASAFVQAYIEFADGTTQNVSTWTGGGVYNTGTYYPDGYSGPSIYYAQLNY